MGGITKKRLSIGRIKIKDANLKNDLPAALEVLNAEFSITVINCHLCKHVPLAREHLKQLEFWPDIYLNKLENEFWVHKKVHHLDFIYIWDVLVPIYLNHPDIFNENKIKIKASSLDDIHDGRLYETEKNGTEINMPTCVNNKTKFYQFTFKNWKRLDRQVRKETNEYINFKDNKIKIFIIKALFSLMVPIFLRFMYKKEGDFYIEK